jgi:stage II sporulation protein D
MKIIRSLLLTLLFAIASNTAIADDTLQETIKTNPASKIRVLLESDTPSVLLEVRGPYYIFNPYDGSRVSSGLLGKRFIIRSTANGIRWGGEFPGIHQISVVPRSPETSILVNGVQYDGNILIYKIGNRINIINEVAIESFVKSKLTDEFTFPLEHEVMSAIAIVARTDAYYNVKSNPHAFWHIKTNNSDYSGNALIVPDSPVVHAVDATKDLILVHPQNGKNEPFAACWNEHSGGKTAAYNAIYRKEVHAPKLGVEAPHAALDREESKWNLSIPLNEFSSILDLPSKIKSIETYKDPASGKVYGLRVNDEVGSVDIDFFTVQKKLGSHRLLSNDMTVTLKGNTIVVSGYGKGNGVGLCLYSASAMAQNGDMAVKILSKFFPDTFLINLSAIPSN